ncbi:MAG: isoprenylcysteine carboxylmethyltransferase family protein [Bryocella sp.]
MIFCLGFWSPWNYWLHLDHNVGNSTAREWLFTLLGVHLSLRYEVQFFVGITTLALLLTALGAIFRVWGTAYVTPEIVASHDMHGETMLVDGPYRRTRNPLYLGTLLHTIGIAMIMPPSGALFTIVLIWILQIRLALAEEPFLAAKFGDAYVAYAKRVPRFIPSLRPLIAGAGQTPQWWQAVLGEFYFVGVFVVIAIFGWGFDPQPMIRGVIISLGAWLFIRALLPQTKKA